MPELPDVIAYVEALDRHCAGKVLQQIRLQSPFLLRSVEPPIKELDGRTVTGFSRIGKRIVWEFEEEPARYLVLHPMIAGRIRKRKAGAKLSRKTGLAAFDFDGFTLVLTEASSKKRASLYVVGSRDGLADHDPGGIDVMSSTVEQFQAALTRRNHTIKRALTDPRYLSGIGNAYSDEILHHAQMSPFKQTQKSMTDADFAKLHASTREVLEVWTQRFREEVGDGFPDKVTAFRDEMAVHGKYGEPCPVCERKVQRIRYADNEMNYCAQCQTDGKLLADRSLSQLLKKDWPKTLDQLEAHMDARRVDGD